MIDSAVIIDPAFLGDVVFDAPLVRALKERCSTRRVGIVVRPPADQLASFIYGVDAVHVFDKRGRDRGLGGLMRMARELANERYEAALIPHPSMRSAMLAARAGIRRRIGHTSGFFARMWLTDRRRAPESDTFVMARLRLVDATEEDAACLVGTVRAPRHERAPGERMRVGLVIGSEWETKRWSIDQAAKLCASIDHEAIEIVLLGSEKERPIYEHLRTRTGSAMAGVEDRVGGTIAGLVDRIASLDVLIAGDTGPLHIARGLGVPVIALFGPTAEAKHRFRDEDRVLAVDLDCRPCSAHGGRICPRGHHRCMRELEADRVSEILIRLSKSERTPT
jgi:heptosyltransferase-2